LPRTRADNNNAIHANSPSPLTPWNSVNGIVITSLTSCTSSSLNTSIPVQGNSTKEQFKLWRATKIWPWTNETTWSGDLVLILDAVQDC
jgi:hypothetical protein